VIKIVSKKYCKKNMSITFTLVLPQLLSHLFS
jgi:hypothetical protein